MKILVLNGSPKGNRSNSLKLTNAFLEGFQQAIPSQVDLVEVGKLDLHPCRGCFACWSKTPGKCVIADDMAGIIQKILESDLIVLSFPLYYFGIPAPLKMLMDRQLPMSLPFMASAAEQGGHPSRYDLSGKRFVMISTCGFYTPQGNYDSVNAQFDRIYGPGGYETIYCGEGELFRVPQLRSRTDAYLQQVRRAGREFAAGRISPETRTHLEELLYPRKVFEQMADASWGVEKTGSGAAAVEPALAFTRQMAALYNPASWKGRDQVLEFCYTDVQKTYQILMQETGHKVLTEDFLPSTTRIETPLSVWQRIGSGELDGSQAMMDHLYRVTGSFDIMLNWDTYFGAGTPAPQEARPEKKTNMNLLLLPWIAIWVALAIDAYWGGAAGIALCALLPLTFLKWKPTVFEYLTLSLVGLISLLSLLGGPILILLPASYLLFGLMWTVTAFLKIPLTAYYSMNHYGREQALRNPLFLQTNRILTACWGVLYLLTPIWTYALLTTPWHSLTGAINSVLPILMGFFTAWFQKWYPRHYARRGN